MDNTYLNEYDNSAEEAGQQQPMMTMPPQQEVVYNESWYQPSQPVQINFQNFMPQEDVEETEEEAEDISVDTKELMDKLVELQEQLDEKNKSQNSSNSITPEEDEMPSLENDDNSPADYISAGIFQTNPQGFYQTKGGNPNDIKQRIATLESGGDYKALPWKDRAHTELASSAAGKYQFLWDLHGNKIKKVTGIDSKEKFLNNPAAQEKFMDYWVNNTLTPNAIKLMPLAKQVDPSITFAEVQQIIHFQGPGGAEKFFRTGKGTKDKLGSTPQSYLAKMRKTFNNQAKYGADQKPVIDISTEPYTIMINDFDSLTPKQQEYLMKYHFNS